MPNLTDHDLLIRLDEKVDGLIGMLKEAAEWRVQHEKNDSERIAKLHERINAINLYAACIAIVSSAIGATAMWLLPKLIG